MKDKPVTLLQKAKNFFSKNKHELHALVEQREEDTTPLTSSERDLITAAFQFRTVEVDEVSVPRSDMAYVKLTDTFKNVFKRFQETRFSRMPVIGEDLDDIQGIITLKDVIPYVTNPKSFRLASLLRPATVVPDNMLISRVLQLMKKNKVQQVIVVDEYGGTAGLLSLKDILEELVGEVEDEHEDETAPLCKALGPNRYWVDAKMELDDLIQKLNLTIDIEDEDEKDLPFETVGGLVLHVAGRVPEKGAHINIGTYIFTILEADARRITALELEVKPK